MRIEWFKPRHKTSSSSKPVSYTHLICDPAQYLVDNGIMIDVEGITYERLKEKYNIACIVSNTAPIAANKSLTIVMDLIIP